LLVAQVVAAKAEESQDITANKVEGVNADWTTEDAMRTDRAGERRFEVG